jgi:hypothetical protein
VAYTPKPGLFSLLKNDRKEKDTHPDYRGDGMTVDGQPAWISAWLKEANGKKFFSISIQPKGQRADAGDGFRGGSSSGMAGSRETGRAADGFDPDSEIPFVTRDSII